MNDDRGNTYGEILKSTALVGGSQVVGILLSIVRTKFLAVLLGPSGVGLIGIYGSMTGLVGSLTGMGIGSSGVRQIAEAAGSRDSLKIAQTILTLRRTALILGFLGMILLAVLSRPICSLTFGHTKYAGAVALLSVTLLLGAVSGGQTALIQGLRRIKDLAKLTVWGAVFATVFSVPLVYLWGEKGIVPFLMAVAVMGILPSWWYARKIPLPRVRMSWQEVRREAGALLGLGLVFMASGLMTAATMYFLRVIVVRQLGMEAAGFYQAASSLSSFYVGIILGAMGADFYPRLTSVAHDNEACNRLVNEQAEVGLLISVPGILATIVFAPLVIEIFYSAKFLVAVEVLRWQILGLFLRITCWPMGFILLAKGEGKLFFWTELIANAVHLGLIWGGIQMFGLAGTGIAFFCVYVFYWMIIFAVVRGLSDFSWSRSTMRLCLTLFPVVAIVFLMPFVLSGIGLYVLGAVLIIATGAYSATALFRTLGPAHVRNAWARLVGQFGFSIR